MKQIDINTPDGKTISLNAPDDATPESIHQAAANAMAHYQSQAKPTASAGQTASTAMPGPVGLAANLMSTDPGTKELVLKGAGFEAGSMLGPMGAAAGNAAGGALADAVNNPNTAKRIGQKVVNTLSAPMMNPGQTVQNATSLAQEATGPGAKDFAKRRAIDAGTGLVAGGIARLARGTKVTGPMTAGIKNPETVIPGKSTEILKQMGKVKDAARLGDIPQEASRLRRMLVTPTGRAKLADEAIKIMNFGDPDKLSATHVLAYRQALGQMEQRGGTFANDYAQAGRKLTAVIEQKWPDLAKNLQAGHEAMLARGVAPHGAGLVDTIQQIKSGAMDRLTTMPAAQRVIGAGVRGVAEAANPAFNSPSAAMTAYKALFARKKKNK